MTKCRLEPFFLDSTAGRLFLLLRAPARVDHCVLFVPPFAEEMNKCRRQVTKTAQALVERGYAVLLLDLFGTGDSEGDFANATWDIWKANISAAMSWAEGAGLKVDTLVATRLGCALAAQSLADAKRTVSTVVFWQPIDSGRQFMRQFLRLRAAASIMEGDTAETVAELWRRLDEGDCLDIAGYKLSASLWCSVAALELTSALTPSIGRLKILEVAGGDYGEMSAVGQRVSHAAEETGIPVSGERVPGMPFWMASEIVTSSDLTQCTVAWLTDDSWR